MSVECGNMDQDQILYELFPKAEGKAVRDASQNKSMNFIIEDFSCQRSLTL